MTQSHQENKWNDSARWRRIAKHLGIYTCTLLYWKNHLSKRHPAQGLHKGSIFVPPIKKNYNFIFWTCHFSGSKTAQKFWSSNAERRPRPRRQPRPRLPYGFAIWLCHIAIWLCHMALPYGFAIWHCHMALPYGLAIWLCHMALPYGLDIWLRHMALP